MNDKINVIIENHSFQYHLRNIEYYEKHREFCKHDMQHFLDVARLMYIINLENALNIPKYMIYATALLHDIGRGLQYENGTPHHISSVEIAKDILQQVGYDGKEIYDIIEAIGDHRISNEKLNGLNALLYKCDKLSRNCSHCKATDGCKWPQAKKNFKIIY
jgi:uncharacterized protein